MSAITTFLQEIKVYDLKWFEEIGGREAEKEYAELLKENEDWNKKFEVRLNEYNALVNDMLNAKLDYYGIERTPDSTANGRLDLTLQQLAQLRAIEQAATWISAKDKLPENRIGKIVYTEQGSIVMMYYEARKNGWIDCMGYERFDVIYWMEKPKPPQEAK